MLAWVIFMTVAMLPLSLWMVIKNPFNIAAITAALTWIFSVLPAIYFQSTGIVPSYSWRIFLFIEGPLSDPHQSLITLMLLSLMATAFTIGASAAWLVAGTPNARVSPPRQTSSVATAIMVGVWGLSALYFFKISGWDIKNFLLPVMETVRPSGYLETVFIMMPLAIVLKAYWAKGRLDGWAYFWIIMSLMAVFSRDQRRDFVTAALFLVGMVVLVGDAMQGSGRDLARNDRSPKSSGKRIMGLVALALGAALVPALWYSRVYFTSAYRGKIVDPTQIRSVSDLLLGSPATGYPTLGLIRDYMQHAGVQF